jgi:hypothetical protein
MRAMSKAVSFLAVAVALTLSCGHVFAKGGGGGGGGSHPTQVKTSGVSAVPSSAGGGQSKSTWCRHDCRPYPPYHYFGPPGPNGTQSGNDPRGPNRGPGNPVLHPK